MKVKVNVKQEFIDKGTKSHPCLCPVGLAMCEALGVDPNVRMVGVGPVGVFGFAARVFASGDLPLPDGVERFVFDFDEGKDVAPFEFEFDAGDVEANRQRWEGGR